MSTALRIASVTQVLKDLLNNGLVDHDVTGTMGGNVNVTALPPDRIDTSTDKEVSQLNIFMYSVSYNQGWRNVAQPTYNSNGDRVSNPPLAIDLHYLLTAYGSAELHTDILLGFGMQLLHETAVLDRDAIRTSIGPPTLLSGNNLPDSLKLLSTSELAEQIEQIKITPELLTIEDISKLWAAFGAKYRPTAAYKATVVLIESKKSTKTGLPVKGRNIYVKPFKQPVIEKIMSQAAIGQAIVEDQKILKGYRLVLTGNQFSNEIVQVSIDGKTVDSITSALSFEDTSLSFILPAELNAGIHQVQIIHPILMGTPPVLHEGITSQANVFVLSPEITGVPVVSNPSGSGNQPRSATIAFKVSPPVEPGQRLVLLLNEMSASQDAQAYSFQMPVSEFLSPPQPIEDISIKISGVKQASYLVRVQVEGAESPLKNDAMGNYNSPVVTIP